jgi:hypothetical protein
MWCSSMMIGGDLKPGKRYIFTVEARNVFGKSKATATFTTAQ